MIQAMKVNELHKWQVSTAEAREIQSGLADKVITDDGYITPNFIAGIDISSSSTSATARGAVVVLHYPELNIVEVQVAEGNIEFPYIPGLLSFRECPLIMAACEKLCNAPDLILVDGQGIAHPRRFGLASHVGLFLDVPTIGCAKSRLCGRHEPVGAEAGSYAELLDEGEVIGAALRTRSNVKPIFVSVGHKINLDSALHWVMQCCRGYRLPEPTRLAHLAAGATLSSEQSGQVVLS